MPAKAYPARESDVLVAKPSPARSKVHPDVVTPSRKDVWGVLLAVRIVNALTVQTFFQPDEYFQSLEPAWRLAFGERSGAWMTWEWQKQLRSSIHPTVLALVYSSISWLGWIFGFPPNVQSEFLIAGPKTFHAITSATMDFYVWKLSGRFFGSESTDSNIAVRSLALRR